MRNNKEITFATIHHSYLLLLPLIFSLLSLLLSSCSDPKLENPFDPESTYNTTPMSGELALSQLTDSEVKLQWQLNNTIVGNYIIKRQINAGGYEILTTVDKTTNTYNDTGLLTTNTYHYQVIGANGDVQTEPLSNSINPSFADITNFNIQQENLFTAKLTWQHNCSYEEGYIIERQEISSQENALYKKGTKLPFRRGEVRQLPDKGVRHNEKNIHKNSRTTRDFIQLADLPVNTFEFIDDTLLPNHTYEYRIHAYTELNCSNDVVEALANTFPAPTNLTYDQLTITSIELNWQDNSDVEDGFMIDKKVGSNAWQIGFATVAEDIETWTDANAEINEDLQYRVYAFSGSNQSTSIETGVIDNTIPAPTNLTFDQLTITSIALNWDDNSYGEDGFKTDKKVGTNAWQIEYATVTENDTTWTDTNAEINEDLQYRVYAYSGSNQSTSIETGIIDNSIPAPINLQITQLTWTSCGLSWEFNGIGGEEGFKIERRLTGGSWLEITQIDINTLYFEDTGLTEGETYEYRVFAYFSLFCGNAATGIIELIPLPVSDYDGNVYQVVQIGDQFWMAENLKVTHYRNGDAIQHETNNSSWANLSTGAYCYYNNDPANGDIYGALYNWYAANDTRGLAPDGWHIPSDEEIMILEMELGMSYDEAHDTGFRGTNEGSKMAGGYDLWQNGALRNDPEFGSSGFDFLPGGDRSYSSGNFYSLGDCGYFWSATEDSASTAWRRYLSSNGTQVSRYYSNKHCGYSVRCIRDQD